MSKTWRNRNKKLTIHFMKAFLKSVLLGIIIIVASSTPYNNAATVNAGPFGRCGSYWYGVVDGGTVVDCDYHFFRCDCARNGDWPLVVG